MVWRDCISMELDEQLNKPALGLEIADWFDPKHIGIIAYIALSM